MGHAIQLPKERSNWMLDRVGGLKGIQICSHRGRSLQKWLGDGSEAALSFVPLLGALKNELPAAEEHRSSQRTQNGSAEAVREPGLPATAPEAAESIRGSTESCWCLRRKKKEAKIKKNWKNEAFIQIQIVLTSCISYSIGSCTIFENSNSKPYR